MKKILILTLILTLMLGCSKEGGEGESNVIPVTNELLVGKWYNGDSDNFQIIQFLSSGSGRYDHIKGGETKESYKITFKVDSDGETIIIDKIDFITNENLGTTKAIIYNDNGAYKMFVVGHNARFVKMTQ